MSYLKKGFFGKKSFDRFKFFSMKNLFLYSSNKPGFIENINKGIDDNGLKGGIEK
ncbi:MAG: hypothetical protein AABW83_02630 [Nanoarchaeota archaeon]